MVTGSVKRVIYAFFIFIFLLCGCGINTESDMFALPEMPEMQKTLIETVDSVRGGGFEYSEPRSGLNRQSLQLMDLDGDGEEEGIAFLRDVSETYKTFIYIFEKDEQGFSLFDIIEGSEKELYTVSYSDLLGRDGYEIIVEWGADRDGSHPVTVYNVKLDGMEKILDISATQFSVSDIDGDAKNDFVAVVKRGEYMYADVYTSDDGTIDKKCEIRLANQGGKLLRIKTGGVTSSKNGVFIEREAGDGVITDVITFDGERFINLLPQGDVCVSRAFCADVNGDGIIEIPKEAEPQITSEEASGCYRWNALTDDGKLRQTAFTYHSFSDGWYLSMPVSWSGSVRSERTTVRPGGVVVSFSTLENIYGDDPEQLEAPLFSVHVLTGGNRKQHAEETGKIIIAEREDTLFAAEVISESYLATKIDEQFLKSIFKNRESEWISEILFA